MRLVFLYLLLCTGSQFTQAFDFNWDTIFGDDAEDLKRHISEDAFQPIGNEYKFDIQPEEVDFHLFNSHDYDKNGKLDGLEVLSAMQHKHSHEGLGSIKSFQSDIVLIDNILHHDDYDGDGYLDYTEFARAKRRSPKNNAVKIA